MAHFELIHEVTLKYEYDNYVKESSFKSNKKIEDLIINLGLLANKISNTCIALPINQISLHMSHFPNACI